MSHQPRELTELFRIEAEIWKIRKLKGEEASKMRKKLFERADYYSNKFKKR